VSDSGGRLVAPSHVRPRHRGADHAYGGGTLKSGSQRPRARNQDDATTKSADGLTSRISPLDLVAGAEQARSDLVTKHVKTLEGSGDLARRGGPHSSNPRDHRRAATRVPARETTDPLPDRRVMSVVKSRRLALTWRPPARAPGLRKSGLSRARRAASLVAVCPQVTGDRRTGKARRRKPAQIARANLAIRIENSLYGWLTVVSTFCQPL